MTVGQFVRMVCCEADLGEHPVQPLERPVKMKLNPARRAGHCLSAILRSPALAIRVRGHFIFYESFERTHKHILMFLTLTNDMRMVHILVREYTASNP